MQMCLQGEERLLCCVCISFYEGIRTLFSCLGHAGQQKKFFKKCAAQAKLVVLLIKPIAFFASLCACSCSGGC